MPKNIRQMANVFRDRTIFLTLGLSLCSLPFILLFTLPFFGWPGSLTAAVLTFLLALATYLGISLFPKSPEEVGSHARGSSLR